jgi:hypothetical protein
MLKTKSGNAQKRAKSPKEEDRRLEIRDLRFEDMGSKLANHAVHFLQCRQKMLKTKSGSLQKRAKRAREEDRRFAVPFFAM